MFLTNTQSVICQEEEKEYSVLLFFALTLLLKRNVCYFLL